MGYQVYRDGSRWAGYGVPAECDLAGCHERIDRGMAYKCWTWEPTPDGIDGEEVEGCGLFFCDEHSHHPDHPGAEPKPDTAEWMKHMLTNDSWQAWRDENPAEVKKITALLGDS